VPGDRCFATAAITSPLELRRTTRWDGPVRFVERVRTVDCETILKAPGIL